MTKRGGVKQVNNSETSLKINSGFKSIKFGLVSLLTIATLIGATSVSGVATSVMGFSAVGEIDKLINRVKECKSAASKMYDAGLALEAQLQELKGE